MTDENDVVMCTLQPIDLGEQALEWHGLRDAALSTERLEDGVALVFPAALRSRLEELMARESACCSWMSLVMTTAGANLRLEVRAASAEGIDVINTVAGGQSGG